MGSVVEEIAVFLRQLGGGPGADPANAVPRFLIPAIFWFTLALVARGRWREGRSERDGLLAVAAALGCSRELFMLVVEYGSYRGLFDFERVLWFYPPFEHAFELVVQVVAGYAFVRAFRGKGGAVRAYLWTGVATAVLIYVATAPSWASFARSALPHVGPRPEFAQHPGDLVFRIAAILVLAPVVGALLLTRGAGPAPALAAVAFLAFVGDHALMIVNIATGLRHAPILSPIRHNLHMWAVPALLAIYWRESVEALRRGERQLSLVLEGSSDGFWDWDFVTRRFTLSPRALAMLGQEGAEPPRRAREVRPLVHPDDLAAMDAAGLALLEGDATAQAEFRTRGREGAWRWVNARGKVVERLNDGRPVRAAGTLRDVTEARAADAARREMEARLIRGQKLESLGMLAGGVAHDFSNLLTVVHGNLEFALGSTPPGAQQDALRDAQIGAKRAMELTQQLLAYAGRGETRAELVRLDRVAAETARLVKSSLPTGCLLDLQLPDDLPPVFADATQLRQVLTNLLFNAAQAMRSRAGALTLRAGVHDHAGGVLADAVSPEPLPAGVYAWIELEDRGTGMDEATLGRIFDPFFTTRPDGRGLGLAVVLGIVRGHRGAMTVRSELGVGSTFRVYLPVAGADGARAPARPELTLPSSAVAGES